MISTLASGASSLFLLSLLNGIESACATETKCSKAWIAPADGELYPTYEEATNCSIPHVPAEVDAIIVGAGYSGLMSAYTIHNTGYTTLVLEAKDRIGGKVRSSKLSNGGIIELGATWINNETQPSVTRLAEMFGLDLVVQYVEGESIFEDYDGQVRRVPSNISYTVSSEAQTPLDDS
jgi:pyruvate/2-oxoglutarate dehydrogenase complex dihydrolipoamide dehydrogenase (E3) component